MLYAREECFSYLSIFEQKNGYIEIHLEVSITETFRFIDIRVKKCVVYFY